jgi:HEAT repeat protein
MPEWLERSRHAEARAAVLAEVDRRIKADLKGALLWLRDLFFSAETDVITRREIAARIGRTRHTQLFNLVFGHYLLGGEPERVALVVALGEFAQPTTVPALVERWNEADYQERLAILAALERVAIPQALEFFSQLFNGERDIPGADPTQVRALRKQAGDALSRHLTG